MNAFLESTQTGVSFFPDANNKIRKTRFVYTKHWNFVFSLFHSRCMRERCVQGSSCGRSTFSERVSGCVPAHSEDTVKLGILRRDVVVVVQSPWGKALACPFFRASNLRHCVTWLLCVAYLEVSEMGWPRDHLKSAQTPGFEVVVRHSL